MSGKPKDQLIPERGIVAGIRQLEIVQDRRRRRGISQKEMETAAIVANEKGGTVEYKRGDTVFRFTPAGTDEKDIDIRL